MEEAFSAGTKDPAGAEEYYSFQRRIKRLTSLSEVRSMRGELHRSLDIDLLQLNKLIELLENKKQQLKRWIQQ